MSDKRYRVAEVFGPTIQGEGSMIGRKTMFVRFGGCDYRCSWCDSPHAVLPHLVAQLPQKNTEEIVQDVLDVAPSDACPWVTFSGGNPALLNLDDVVHDLHSLGYAIAVETQGTVWKDWLRQVECLTISPKPPSSGNMTAHETLDAFMNNVHALTPANLKVVVFNENDYHYAKAVSNRYPFVESWVQVGNDDPNLPTVGNNAQGDPDAPVDKPALLARMKWLMDKVANDPGMDARVTPQLHVLAWGNELGR